MSSVDTSRLLGSSDEDSQDFEGTAVQLDDPAPPPSIGAVMGAVDTSRLLGSSDEDGDAEADTAPSVHQSAAPVVSAEETPVHVALHRALKGPEKSAQELEAELLQQKPAPASTALHEGVPPHGTAPSSTFAEAGPQKPQLRSASDDRDWVEQALHKQALVLSEVSSGSAQASVVDRMLAMGTTMHVSDTLDGRLAILLDKCNLAAEAPVICLKLGLRTVDDLAELVEEDVVDLDLRPVPRRRLLRAIQQSKLDRTRRNGLLTQQLRAELRDAGAPSTTLGAVFSVDEHGVQDEAARLAAAKSRLAARRARTRLTATPVHRAPERRIRSYRGAEDTGSRRGRTTPLRASSKRGRPASGGKRSMSRSPAVVRRRKQPRRSSSDGGSDSDSGSSSDDDLAIGRR